MRLEAGFLNPKSFPSFSFSDAPSFQIIRKISSSKFPIYSVYIDDIDQIFALKLFPFDETQTNPSFLIESRFCRLSHENVIAFKHVQKSQKIRHKKIKCVGSYIIMELAPERNNSIHR